MKKRCVIFCAGEDGELPFAFEREDYIICCDAGLNAAKRRGITPNLIVGDFDSYLQEAPKGIETLRFPVEKDDTDSMLAVREGLSRGFSDFILLCSLGGRLDHTIANIQTLVFIKENGGEGQLIGPDDTARLLCNGSLDILRREGYTFSLFALGEKCEGVTLSGMQYPLNDATVTNGFPIGLGNHIMEPSATVSVKCGTLLIVESKLTER